MNAIDEIDVAIARGVEESNFHAHLNLAINHVKHFPKRLSVSTSSSSSQEAFSAMNAIDVVDATVIRGVE